MYLVDLPSLLSITACEYGNTFGQVATVTLSSNIYLLQSE